MKKQFEFILTPERATYLLNKLGDKVISEPYFSEGKDFIKVIFVQEVESLDILDIFHAGIACGMDAMTKH